MDVDSGGGVLVQVGGRFEGVVQVVIGCTEALLPPFEQVCVRSIKTIGRTSKKGIGVIGVIEVIGVTCVGISI